MPTQKPRIALTLDENTMNKLYDLRKTDEYCRCSLSEIVRVQLEKGLALAETQQTPPTQST